MTPRILLFAALSAAVFSGGCARSASPGDGDAQQGVQSEAQAEAQGRAEADAQGGSEPTELAPPTLSVLLGQTGMRGGQLQGVQIGADGTVTAWRGRAVGQNPVDRGFISESEGDSLWAWIREADFFRQAKQYPGNQTRFLAVTVADSTRRATWPIGPGVRPADDPVAHLYDRIMALVE